MLKTGWAQMRPRPGSQQRVPLLQNMRQHTSRSIHNPLSRLGSRPRLQLHTQDTMAVGFGMAVKSEAHGQTGLLWRAQLRPGSQPIAP